MDIKILIADDHRVFIDGMTALLQSVNGIKVLGDAENGEQLIEKASILKPDVILTDVQMPVMDGIQATKEIHKRFPEIKIIALTMHNESGVIKKMLEVGAAGYVLKTIDKVELIEVIKKVASGQKHFSAEVTSRLMNDFSGKQAASPIDTLTKREKEILALIAQGLTDKEIAEKVFLSPLTVITHRKNILSKLGLKNKVEITRFAFDHKLIS
jgi:DNA-binding NarL/FixJ family response regulator